MPAFSHFFLKRLRARSKFSSSWMMTSDKLASSAEGPAPVSATWPVRYVAARTGVKQNPAEEAWALSARRPAHVAAADQVQMDVKHRLPGGAVRVDHGPVS